MSKSLRIPYNKLQTIEVSISRPISRDALVVPRAEVGEITPGPIDVSLIDLELVNGNTTLLEQLVVLSVAKRWQCKRVFEFGTFDGKTSANLAVNLQQDAQIFTIDLPVGQLDSVALPIGKHDLPFILKDRIGVKFGGSAKVIQLYGDTARFDFSLWYGTCDLVFVDACHEYEYVLNDSEIALKLLARGGAVFWHDYGNWVGVTNALNDLYTRDERFRNLRHIVATTLCLLT
jgi:predicted O-methyltransferase YrrM